MRCRGRTRKVTNASHLVIHGTSAHIASQRPVSQSQEVETSQHLSCNCYSTLRIHPILNTKHRYLASPHQAPLTSPSLNLNHSKAHITDNHLIPDRLSSYTRRPSKKLSHMSFRPSLILHSQDRPQAYPHLPRKAKHLYYTSLLSIEFKRSCDALRTLSDH